MTQSTCSKVSVGIVTIVGIACCITGGIMYKIFPDIVKDKIEKELPLTNDSLSFGQWEKSSATIYFKVYFFNITNPEEVMKNQKPILGEVGPYVFRQEKTRGVIEWLKEDNITMLKYDDHRTYYHVEGNINDEIYHLNALYVIMVDSAVQEDGKTLKKYFLPEDMKKLQEMVDKKQLTLVEKHSINQILFEGYDSELIRQAKTMKGIIQFGIKIKYKEKDVFGLYHGRNGTKQHSYTINTGQEDIQNLGKIVKYDKKKVLDLWGKDQYCNMINGTDGTMFAPGVTTQQKLYAFIAELGRSVYFDYDKDVVVQDINAYKFVLSEKVFEVENEENKCFCNSICDDGLVKLIPNNPLGNDQQIIFSSPHFYKGNASLANVDGLKPVQEKHENFLSVEPNTGIVIGAAKRLQVNAHLRKLDFPIVKDMDSRVFPIAWFEESAEIDSPTAKEFRSRVINPLILGPKLLIALIGIGAFFILLSASVCIYKRRK